MAFKKICITVLSILLIIIMTTLVCYSDENAKVVQAYISENEINVFINAILQEDELSLKISNQLGVIKDYANLSEVGLPVYTTILVDTSTSVPTIMRDKIIELIGYMIENIHDNELYKIVTFGEQLVTLQDFTSDRYDLSNSIKNIEFSAQQSMIYDAVYNTIPQIQPVEGEPCFYRTVVISDGVDVASSGITKEELFLKLQNETYPVNVIAVSKEKSNEPQKDLSALTRISEGLYTNFVPESDCSAVASVLDNGEIYWIRAEIPEQLLDGSVRQIDISDGSNRVQFDIKVPIYDSDLPAADTYDNVIEQESAVTTSAPEVSETLPKSETVVTNDEVAASASKRFQIIFVISAVAAVVLIIIILIVVVKNRKSKKSQSIESLVQTTLTPDSETKEAKTEFIGDYNENGNYYIIKLSSIKNSGNVWTLPVDGEILIGRSADCAVCLSDKSVSREQCKIIIDIQGVSLVDLSHTNKTLINGKEISGITKLSPGDSLKIGREVLRVDYIQSITQEEKNNVYSENPSHKNDTESLF